MEARFYKEEHHIFRKAFKDFVKAEITPNWEQWNKDKKISRDIWYRMGELGYLCPWIDEKYGGSGAGFEYSVIIDEELSKSEVAGANGMGIHSDIIVPYIYHNEFTNKTELHFTPEIKNIGDIPFSGTLNYDGNSSYWINNQYHSRAWGFRWGALDPDETWIPKSGAGVLIYNYFPRIFSIEFEITPIDSNPNNNYIRQVFLAKGKGIFPIWMHLPFLELL